MSSHPNNVFRIISTESALAQFSDFPEAAHILATASVSDSTRKTYNAALRLLSNWLGNRELTDRTLSKYLVHLHEIGRSPSTASGVITAVRFISKHTNMPTPIGPFTVRILNGFRNNAWNRGRGQADGIGYSRAEEMSRIAANRRSKYTGFRDAAIILVASDGLLRASEIIALDCEDVQFNQNGTGHLTIRRSKTDQEGKGSIHFLGPPTIRRLRNWLEFSGINSGPLFRPYRNTDKPPEKRMGYRTLSDAIKRCARDAGITERITSHSFRIGAAQDLTTLGASLVELQIAGRWKSPSMPAHYARAQLASKSAVAKLRYEIETS